MTYHHCPYCGNDYRGPACPCGEQPDPIDLADYEHDRRRDDRLTEGR